ncbi:uncharacterized protein LOC143019032 [Oratosquilla oratoria]|uniref:uncharacterized protein LOC143019032 n=1 Tax=Oratosquilla oratoria TaxID=337810 RepID=UPI003F77783A
MCLWSYQRKEPFASQSRHHTAVSPDIIVRRADKSSIYVILNKEDYLSKLNLILSDTTKFKKISNDPTSKLKVKVNKLITANNAAIDHLHTPIIGEYSPGYIYGNVKTHKPDAPLRPIISQVTTPTYRLAKQINGIITPYIPKKYSLRSIDEFFRHPSHYKAPRNHGIARCTVLILPRSILPTINIIMDNVYHHPQLPPPKIPENILKKLLIACTTEAPFKSPTGHLFYQIEGVAMGSPLGCTFAEFYMCNLENSVLQNPDIRPHLTNYVKTETVKACLLKPDMKDLPQKNTQETIANMCASCVKALNDGKKILTQNYIINNTIFLYNHILKLTTKY